MITDAHIDLLDLFGKRCYVCTGRIAKAENAEFLTFAGENPSRCDNGTGADQTEYPACKACARKIGGKSLALYVQQQCTVLVPQVAHLRDLRSWHYIGRKHEKLPKVGKTRLKERRLADGDGIEKAAMMAQTLKDHGFPKWAVLPLLLEIQNRDAVEISNAGYRKLESLYESCPIMRDA